MDPIVPALTSPTPIPVRGAAAQERPTAFEPPADAILRLGSVWAAEVLAVEEAALVVALGSERFLVASEVPFEPASRLLLKVVETGPTPVFELVEHGAAAGALAAVASVLEALDQVGTERAIGAAPPAIEPGISTTSDGTGPPGPDTALIAESLRQIVGAALDGDTRLARDWLLEGVLGLTVPAAFPPGRDAVAVELDREATEGGAGDDASQEVRLFAHLPSLGPVEVTLHWQRRALAAGFVVACPDTGDLVAAHAPSLERSLSAAGCGPAAVTLAVDAQRLARRAARTRGSSGAATRRGPGRLVSLRA